MQFTAILSLALATVAIAAPTVEKRYSTPANCKGAIWNDNGSKGYGDGGWACKIAEGDDCKEFYWTTVPPYWSCEA